METPHNRRGSNVSNEEMNNTEGASSASDAGTKEPPQVGREIDYDSNSVQYQEKLKAADSPQEVRKDEQPMLTFAETTLLANSIISTRIEATDSGGSGKKRHATWNTDRLFSDKPHGSSSGDDGASQWEQTSSHHGWASGFFRPVVSVEKDASSRSIALQAEEERKRQNLVDFNRKRPARPQSQTQTKIGAFQRYSNAFAAAPSVVQDGRIRSMSLDDGNQMRFESDPISTSVAASTSSTPSKFSPIVLLSASDRTTISNQAITFDNANMIRAIRPDLEESKIFTPIIQGQSGEDDPMSTSTGDDSFIGTGDAASIVPPVRSVPKVKLTPRPLFSGTTDHIPGLSDSMNAALFRTPTARINRSAVVTDDRNHLRLNLTSENRRGRSLFRSGDDSHGERGDHPSRFPVEPRNTELNPINVQDEPRAINHRQQALFDDGPPNQGFSSLNSQIESAHREHGYNPDTADAFLLAIPSMLEGRSGGGDDVKQPCVHSEINASTAMDMSSLAPEPTDAASSLADSGAHQNNDEMERLSRHDRGKALTSGNSVEDRNDDHLFELSPEGDEDDSPCACFEGAQADSGNMEVSSSSLTFHMQCGGQIRKSWSLDHHLPGPEDSRSDMITPPIMAQRKSPPTLIRSKCSEEDFLE